MKNRNFLRVGLLGSLLGTIMGSCGDDEEPTPNNQIQPNPNPDPEPNPDPNKPVDQEKLVSELKCTVDEFATKYTTLKKGEKVTVTLTDVSDANIAKVSETLKKMSADPISKAGEAKYIVTLILESISNALKTIPADTFKGVEVLREVVIPACGGHPERRLRRVRKPCISQDPRRGYQGGREGLRERQRGNQGGADSERGGRG